MFIAPSPSPTKKALELTGFDTGGVRLPLVGLTDVEESKIRNVMLELQKI